MGLFQQVVLRSIRRQLSSLGSEKRPFIAGHKLLYTCNLRCKMCPFWRRQDEKLLSLEEEKLMLKALADFGVSFMGFEGGEPLLRRDIKDILAASHSLFHTSLVTNGWFLKERARDIKDYLDYLFVSIDGIGELHDRLRGIPGSFKKAVEGIKEATKYLPVSISSTITRENMHQAEEIVELGRSLGVSVSFQVAYDYSTADKMSPDAQRLRGVLERLLEMKKQGYPIVESKEYFMSVINSWYHNDPWECKPWLTINIDPQGRVVTPCYVLNEYSGTQRVWETDLRKLWASIDWDSYRSCNKCALSCYLEPSLFSWRNPSMVRERIIDNVISYIRSRGSPAPQ